MQGKRAGIFLPLLILMAIKVDSKFQRSKDWNVYDIELRHGMKSAVNNNEAYHSPKSVGRTQQTRNSSNPWQDSFFCSWLWDCDVKNSTDDPSSPSPQPVQPAIPPQRPPPIPPPRPPPSHPDRIPQSEPVPEPQPEPVRSNCPKIPDDYSRFECSPNAYKFHKEELIWSEAQRQCQQESAEIAVIENGAQYDIVGELAKHEIGNETVHFHIQIKHQTIQYPWRTIHGTFDKEAPYDPDTNMSYETCGGFIIIPNIFEGIHYSSCDYRRSFMCEIRVPYECA